MSASSTTASDVRAELLRAGFTPGAQRELPLDGVEPREERRARMAESIAKAQLVRRAFCQMSAFDRQEVRRLWERWSDSLPDRAVRQRRTLLGRLLSYYCSGKNLEQSAEMLALACEDDWGSDVVGFSRTNMDRVVWHLASSELRAIAYWTDVEPGANDQGVTVPMQTPREIYPAEALLAIVDHVVQRNYSRLQRGWYEAPAPSERHRNRGGSTSPEGETPSGSPAGGYCGPPGAGSDVPF